MSSNFSQKAMGFSPAMRCSGLALILLRGGAHREEAVVAVISYALMPQLMHQEPTNCSYPLVMADIAIENHHF